MGSYGRDFWDKQQSNNSLPGLFQEMEEHLVALGVTNLRDVSKYTYKKKVKEYVVKLNREDLLADIGKYKKLDLSKLSNEAFERNPYIDKLSLEDGRMRYRIEARLVPTILGNYPSKYRRQGVSLAYPLCSASPPRTSSSITA